MINFSIHSLWIETNAIFSRSYTYNCFMKWGIISKSPFITICNDCFKGILQIPIKYPIAITAPSCKAEEWIKTFPPSFKVFLINLLEILKNFLASSSELLCRSIFKYSKYCFLFVYYLEVTLRIWVIPASKRYFVFNPETKSP